MSDFDDDSQLSRLEGDEDVRKAFNVKTDAEVRDTETLS